jgi:nucleotide-binding universal stress UspA family protein
MFNSVLIATDGSEVAAKAVDAGLRLAKVLKAKVTAVTVTEPWTSVAVGEMGIAFPVEEYEESVAANAKGILDGVTTAAKTVGINCETLHVKDSFPAEGIVETAEKLGCDLIVMASHGRRGIAKLVLGSQAARVLTLASVPVLVCR